MGKLTASLGIAYMTLVSATAQTVDLFNREGKDIIPKEQFIAFYEKESTGGSRFRNSPTNEYNTFNITSPNELHRYQISIGGYPNKDVMGGGYEFIDIYHNGKRLIRKWGKDPLGDVGYLTTNATDKNFYIKVPLDDNSFALLFAGLVFDGDDEAGEMIIVVVNQDKATVVYDRPACAYSFTPDPNFAIEFTEKIEWDIEVIEGLEIPAYVKADMKATKHKIWKEGNMLKYKSWN